MWDFYQAMMGRHGGGMTGGNTSGSMMSAQGYAWMMGGASAPGWMNAGTLPGGMLGDNTDPGEIMGSLFAESPGPRVTPEQAAALGNQTPAGATEDRAAHTITFTGGSVELTMLASPLTGRDMTYQAAGLTNPTVIVHSGATVTLTLINADPHTAHGITITTAAHPYGWMPMMAAAAAFPGASIWFLGDPTPAGMHQASVTFTANRIGTYHYLCAVPGHAQKGMFGTFTVVPD
jgi:rusticyanin